MKILGYNISMKKDKRLPLGFYHTSMWLDIDVSKVCDDHPNSACMSGRCMKCSFDACVYNPDLNRWLRQ